MVYVRQTDAVIVWGSLSAASDFAEYAENDEPNTKKHQQDGNSFHDWNKNV